MPIRALQRRDPLADIPQGVADWLVLVARVLMAYIFIVEGYGKIVDYSAVAEYMRDNGVAPFLLPLVILTELGGGLMILGGWKTRWAAIALGGFAILTALVFHWNGADPEQTINFRKDFAIAGGFLALAAWGLAPGPSMPGRAGLRRGKPLSSRQIKGCRQAGQGAKSRPAKETTIVEDGAKGHTRCWVRERYIGRRRSARSRRSRQGARSGATAILFRK